MELVRIQGGGTNLATNFERIQMRRAVAAIGLCSWDRFLVADHYPAPGGYATIERQFEQAGGTTANTCAALARLGVDVMLASSVGDDREGHLLVESLDDAGCDTSMVSRVTDMPTDSSFIILSGAGNDADRTILWVKGAQPRHGGKLPIAELLDHRWLLVDVNDDRLRAFMLELPAHVSPRTQLLGAMTYLTDTDRGLAWSQMLGHEVMFGNERELMFLAGETNTASAVAAARAAMPGTACRVIYLSCGSRGSMAIRPETVTKADAFSVDVVDTTGAGDAFAAGCIWGLTENLTDAGILARGNALGALTCRELGARAGLPAASETLELIQNGTKLHDAAGY